MLKFLQNYGLPISLSEAGPGIDEIMAIIGKDETLNRIELVLEKL